MNNSQQLAERLKEVILDGTWIANTNFKDQLEHLDFKTATTKIQSLNTISILAQHVHYYINGINQVFKGGKLTIKDKCSFDFPIIVSQAAWQNFLIKFWTDTENLLNLIEQLPENKLDQVFVDQKYGTYKRNIEGLIEHSYYHLGQIAIIKKMLVENGK
ncbi:MAG: DUF1572 domain-containing protein [Flavobacteriaceae bacterium]|nr:DUF1572 domain-containing protein [Flavobacteriaceae bacterium]